VFGLLLQGTRTSEIIFLLVEGQQRARVEKGNTSYLIIYKVRKDVLKSLCVLTILFCKTWQHMETGRRKPLPIF
jgi:hypothetical protein